MTTVDGEKKKEGQFVPLAGGNGLSLNSPSDGADERLSVDRPFRLSGFDEFTAVLTLAGVGGGGPRGRLELVVLAKLVAEPCNFLSCGSSPLGSTSLAPAIIFKKINTNNFKFRIAKKPIYHTKVGC